MNQTKPFLPLEEVIFWPGRTIWMGLLTASGAREVSATGYARQPVVFARDAHGYVHLPTVVSFGPARADWPPVWGLAIYHQPHGGTPVHRHALDEGISAVPAPGTCVDVTTVGYAPPVRDEASLARGLDDLLAVLREPGAGLALAVTTADGRHIALPPDVVRHLSVAGHGLPGSVQTLLDEAVRRELAARLWQHAV